MAIINCPECKSHVSNKAASCIKCGYPLAHSKGFVDRAFEKKYVTGESWFAIGFSVVMGMIVVFICAKLGEVGAVFAAIFMLAIIVRVIEGACVYLAIDYGHVILKRGWLSKKTIEIAVDKVESIQIKTGLVGEALGYGDIIIAGAGWPKIKIKNISKPEDFKAAVMVSRR